MLSLPQPKIGTKEVHSASYSRIKASDLKARHVREAPNIHELSRLFNNAAIRSRTEHLSPHAFQTINVTNEEMSNLYTNSVQPPGSPGRQYYDELMNEAPHKKCPYCGQRRVMSIDHYLPKKEYSSLAVTPANLVPACTDCNHAKGSYSPTTDNPALLHPYFDNVQGFRWLYAVVIPSSPPTIRFEVQTDNAPDSNIAERIAQHFGILKLGNLFESHAGETVEQIDIRLSRLFVSSGAEAVRAHLLEEAESWSLGKKNTWQRALFEGLAASDWYCCEYFTNTSR